MVLNLEQRLAEKLKHNVCNSDSPPPTFAPMESIRERRERLGLTQKSLAAECGIHFTHICHIERGNANPSLEVFVKLTDKLNVSPGKLLDMLRQRSGKPASASVTDIQKARERRKRR